MKTLRKGSKKQNKNNMENYVVTKLCKSRAAQPKKTVKAFNYNHHVVAKLVLRLESSFKASCKK